MAAQRPAGGGAEHTGGAIYAPGTIWASAVDFNRAENRKGGKLPPATSVPSLLPALTPTRIKLHCLLTALPWQLSLVPVPFKLHVMSTVAAAITPLILPLQSTSPGNRREAGCIPLLRRIQAGRQDDAAKPLSLPRPGKHRPT